MLPQKLTLRQVVEYRKFIWDVTSGHTHRGVKTELNEANKNSLLNDLTLWTIKHNAAVEFWEQPKTIHLSYPTCGARELEYLPPSLIDSQLVSHPVKAVPTKTESQCPALAYR